MKFICIILLAFCFSIPSVGQNCFDNFIGNSSFEKNDLSKSPMELQTGVEIDGGWYSVAGTTDIMQNNQADSRSPVNTAKEGVKWLGIYSNFYEGIAVKFKGPLETGKKYTLTFWAAGRQDPKLIFYLVNNQVILDNKSVVNHKKVTEIKIEKKDWAEYSLEFVSDKPYYQLAIMGGIPLTSRFNNNIYTAIDKIEIREEKSFCCLNNIVPNSGFEGGGTFGGWNGLQGNCGSALYDHDAAMNETAFGNLRSPVDYPYNKFNFSNKHWIVLCSYMSYTGKVNSAITTKLSKPMIPGRRYLISFYGATRNTIADPLNPHGNAQITLNLSITPYSNWSENIGGIPVFNNFKLEGSLKEWHYYSIEFKPVAAYEYIILQAKDGHHPAIDDICISDLDEPIIPQTTYPVNLNKNHGDFNGDGKTDLLYFGENATAVSLNTGSRFLFANWQIAKRGIFDFWTVGDFNGDGKDDVLNSYGTEGVKVFLSDGKSFLSGTVWTRYGVAAEKFWTVGDFNGDGKDDILRTEAGIGVQILLSTGTAFKNPITWTTTGYGTEGFWTIGDYNGDGKDDILETYNGVVQVLLSTGSLFQTVTNWSVGQTYGQIEKSWRVGDFNNDGKDDILRTKFGSGEVEVLLSTGKSFGFPQKWTNKLDITSSTVLSGDFNGDKYIDIFYIDKANHSICLSNGNRFSAPKKWD